MTEGKNKQAYLDFTIPQRQAIVGMIVHYADILQTFVRALWPLLLLTIFRAKNINWDVYVWVIITIIISVAILVFWSYRNLKFYIDDDKKEFVVEKGILNRQKTSIALDKIQQVNIQQNLVQRILNVYSIEIETSGSMKSEATIASLSNIIASELKNRLINVSSQQRANLSDIESLESAKKVKEIVINEKTIDFDKIVKYSVTGNYLETVFVLLGLFITFYNRVKDLMLTKEGSDIELIEEWVGHYATQFSYFILIGILLLIVFLYNITRTVITYYEIQIRLKKASLWINYGLINRRNLILSNPKVQILKLSSNYIQRKFNLNKLTIHQVSNNIDVDKKSKIQLPGCDKDIFETLFKHIFQKSVPDIYAFWHPSYRKILMPLFFLSILPTVIAIIYIINKKPDSLYYFTIPLLYMLFVSGLIYVKFSRYRLSFSKDFIVKRSGALNVHHEFTHVQKIQSISTYQYLWHRKKNIGHVVLKTAGGDLAFKFGDFDLIQLQVNYWLYRIESR